MADDLKTLGDTTASNYSIQPGNIHPSFPSQASGGTEEHSDSEGSGAPYMDDGSRGNTMIETRAKASAYQKMKK